MVSSLFAQCVPYNSLGGVQLKQFCQSKALHPCLFLLVLALEFISYNMAKLGRNTKISISALSVPYIKAGRETNLSLAIFYAYCVGFC